MKGGRTAPRDATTHTERKHTTMTSMKGGRTAPRDSSRASPASSRIHYFNEGGADCPPRLLPPDWMMPALTLQ